jgi:hypothetical protein
LCNKNSFNCSAGRRLTLDNFIVACVQIKRLTGRTSDPESDAFLTLGSAIRDG